MLTSPVLLSFAMMTSLHCQRFSLLNHHLSVVDGILICVLITLQIDVVSMHSNNYEKSIVSLPTLTVPTTKTTATEKISSMPVINVKKNANTTTTILSTLPSTTTTSAAAIMSTMTLLNRASSTISISADAVIDPVFLSQFRDNGSSKNCTNVNCTNVATNVDVNNFPIGTAVTVKRKRWIHDLLPTTTTNTTELTSTTTSATKTAKNTPIATRLTNESQNNSFVSQTISPTSPTKFEFISAATFPSAFTNISNDLQLPQQQSKLRKRREETRILSRPKRFLTFPEGASFTVTACIAIGVIGNIDYRYLAYGLNWGVAYDLPNTSWVLNNLHGFSRHPVPAVIYRRRTRRALYGEIEALVDTMGYNGRDCILRALCESKQYFKKYKLSMIGEMMRTIFSLPKQRLFTRELRGNTEIKLYDHAYRHTRDIDCSEQYDCNFSLLGLAFGKYSTPPSGY